MYINNKLLRFSMILNILVMACSLSFGEDLSEMEKLQTAAVETISAIPQGQQTSPTGQPPLPTITSPPSGTQPEEPTQTPSTCNNQANFISETVADGTEFNVNENFTKTWRLKNVGTCTWNTNYRLVFSEGEIMGGPSSQNLPYSVSPGEQVDISVGLTAPSSSGIYQGKWKVADDQGQFFVHNITVKIEVITDIIIHPPPEGPPPDAFIQFPMPDLVVTNFYLDPPIPTMGEEVHVFVEITNQGTVESGTFYIDWYGLSTASAPASHSFYKYSIAPDTSVVIRIFYTFESWYPINKTTIVYIDVGNNVDESNEDNNSASIYPFGVYKP